MTDLTPSPLDLDELRKVAEKAQPGPWEWPSRWNGEFSVQVLEDGLPCIVATTNTNFPWCKPTAAHIAAFNPETCKRLLALVESLQKEREEEMGRNARLMRENMRLAAELEAQKNDGHRLQTESNAYAQELSVRTDERDLLRAENERLKAAIKDVLELFDMGYCHKVKGPAQLLRLEKALGLEGELK
jgi:hypothetical protein